LRYLTGEKLEISEKQIRKEEKEKLRSGSDLEHELKRE